MIPERVFKSFAKIPVVRQFGLQPQRKKKQSHKLMRTLSNEEDDAADNVKELHVGTHRTEHLTYA